MDKLLLLITDQSLNMKYIMFGMNISLEQFMKKNTKYFSSLLTDDDKGLSVSKKFSKFFKEKLLNQKQKHDVSLTS